MKSLLFIHLRIGYTILYEKGKDSVDCGMSW